MTLFNIENKTENQWRMVPSLVKNFLSFLVKGKKHINKVGNAVCMCHICREEAKRALQGAGGEVEERSLHVSHWP
jgi:hypothetical protein